MVYSRSDQIQDEWRNLKKNVQTHLQTVVADRLSGLYWDLSENCGSQPKVITKLFILNETATSYFKEKRVWNRNGNTCMISVFDASDEVLRDWCTEKPDRILMFSYNHTERMFSQRSVSFQALVQTNCLHFPSGEDYDRLPLPAPFDFRQDHATKFLIYCVLVLLAVGIISLFFCHHRPIYRFFHNIWKVYRDRRDWNSINEIIKFRDQRIRAEQERKQKTVQTTVL